MAAIGALREWKSEDETDRGFSLEDVFSCV